MSKQRSRDTTAELAVRRILHREGFRYRCHVRPLASLRREADLVFRGPKVAVFIDGCFWHGCPEHGSWPKANAEWWQAKIEANRARDEGTDRALLEAGWLPVRIWEHELPEDAAARIAHAIKDRSQTVTPS